VPSLEGLETLDLSGTVFVIGGARIYEALLPRCEFIYLTYIFEDHEGDVLFPEFESDFVLSEVLTTHDLYERRLYRRRS
jgi:dihydrofolate reductase